MIHTAEEFIQLRTSSDPAEYYRAAHDSAPDAVWAVLIEHHPDMRVWVAHNKRVPIAVLERLAYDESPHVRGMVAMKRKLPEVLQRHLASDPAADVRFQIACNAKATAAVLTLLAHDPEPYIRVRAIERLAE